MVLIQDELADYEQKLGIVIEDEMVVSADLVQCTIELLKIDAICQALAHKAEKDGEVVKSEASLVVIVLTSLILLLGVWLSFTITRGIVGPLRGTMDVLSAVSIGDLSKRVEIKSTDEVGQMNKCLNEAVAYIKGIAVAADSLGKGDLTVRVKGRSEQDLLSENFNKAAESMSQAMGGIASNTQALSRASSELTEVSNLMATTAAETAAEANSASSASEQISSNMQMVSASTEEMIGSIREIAKNSAEAANVAAGAVQTAEDTNKTISKLGESSAEIGNVIKVEPRLALRGLALRGFHALGWKRQRPINFPERLRS